MNKIPQLKANRVVKALQRLGFEPVRQRGSHLRLQHPDGHKVTVPQHNRTLFVGVVQ